MIFVTSPDAVSRLTSAQFVYLMKRLLLAECRVLGIPLRAATVPLQITVADGGEDGRVEWEGGADSTDYFPARFTVLQAKAQNLIPSSVAAEVTATSKGKSTLNDAVKEVLRKKGAYIIFCSRPFGGQKIKQLKESIEAVVCKHAKRPKCPIRIEIYDANKIADWVNRHPSTVTWMAESGRGRSIAGFQSQDGWATNPEIYKSSWVDENDERFACEGAGVSRSGKPTKGWTFKQTSAFAQKLLSQQGTALRVVGPSGYGKTRFAFELFNQRSSVADAIDSAALIYADLAIVGDEVLKVAAELADLGATAVLVADECPDDVHMKLAGIVRRAGSMLRLVTLDVEATTAPAADTLLVRLDPTPDSALLKIAKQANAALSNAQSQIVLALSRGYPMMAIVAAQHGASGASTSRSAEELIHRILWGKRTPDPAATKALEVLCLFQWLGIKQDAANEVRLVAEMLAQTTVEVFLEGLTAFRRRGVLAERGKYAQVALIPLATVLGSRRIDLISPDKLTTFFDAAPDRLKVSFLQRLRWLDNTTGAKRLAQRLLAPDRFGNLDSVNSDQGAQFLDQLVHLDPDLAMSTIQSVVGSLDRASLLAIEDGGRRHLVWALEKLAFRAQTFLPAAAMLRRLAAAESEQRIANNATGQFKQLFQMYLAGTQAPLAERMLVLDEGLESEDEAERLVCLEALDTMLTTHHFSRVGGAEQTGSGIPLEDWAPSTPLEQIEFVRQGVGRIVSLVKAGGPAARRSKAILGTHVRELLGVLPLAELKGAIGAIVGIDGLWSDAVQEVNEWLYFDRSDAPPEHAAAVRQYFEELLPSDPIELVGMYAGHWPIDFHDPDTLYQPNSTDFEYATRKVTDLAERVAADVELTQRAVHTFACGQTKTLAPFSQRLATKVPDAMAVFNAALERLEGDCEGADLQFFGGFIAGCDSRDGDLARQCVKLALQSVRLRGHALQLIGAGTLRRSDLDLVASLLESKDVEPRQCASLSYGQRMSHLAADDVAVLLAALAAQGSEGRWAAIAMVSMLLHGRNEVPQQWGTVIRALLSSEELFVGSRGNMDSHHLSTLVATCVRVGVIDGELAGRLTWTIVGVLGRKSRDVFDRVDESMRTVLEQLMGTQPAAVWSEIQSFLAAADSIGAARFADLVGPGHRDSMEAGILYKIPASSYLAWVRGAPDARARFVMKWLPVAVKTLGQPVRWHDATQAFVEEFFQASGVLAELAWRLMPHGWWGSLEPHLQPAMDLLGLWHAHPRSEIRAFALAQSQRFAQEAQSARSREDDDAVRFL